MTASHTRRACDNGGACWCSEHPEEVARINAPVAAQSVEPPTLGKLPAADGVTFTAAQMNALARKVGAITNRIEAENERHRTKMEALMGQLDDVYGKLGAEAFDGSR